MQRVIRDEPLARYYIVFDRGSVGGAELGVSGLLFQNNLVLYDQHEPRNSLETIVPDLATNWSWSGDGTKLTFKLRQGVKFHSGNEMTALDVSWTFDRLKKSPDFKGIFAPFEALNVIDQYTIDIVTKEPYPLVLHTAKASVHR